MAESRVKVGVRIRPLLTKEKGQNVTFNSYDNKSVSFKGQTYTYDHVFGMELSQYQLYAQTAAPMLKSFMEGYNCTIMAYGQTGSGKTFSMGTSDIAQQDTENQGLISRFVTDLFENLNASKADGDLLNYQVKASYLEIYGEDVYDLLPSESRNGNSRVSLNVREDENGKMFVQGQNEYAAGNAESTLELLSSGARHRITASTAMNAESSRSHSVFTLHLEQSVRGSNSSLEPVTGEEVVQVMCAKLTFVDLAGSERIKRTGAEGQRLKEGIQINSGLFNLGQVINSLADEQKIKNKAQHVPYRNSKLTHLLKDALGGNSQTLFLACVSPAESNESETQSTLQYAKQARNIQNKPVQNVDKVQKELQRLRLAVKMWTMKAVTSIFGQDQAASASSVESLEQQAASLLSRADVADFVAQMNSSISEKVAVTARSPRKVRLSMGAVLSPSPKKTKQAGGLYSPVRPIRSNMLNQLRNNEFSEVYSPPCSFPGVNGAYMGNAGRESILTAFPSLAAAGSSVMQDEPEETERLLSRMLDMVQKEKEQFLSSANGNIDEAETEEAVAGADGEEDTEAGEGLPSDDIVQMDQTIQEKEEILLKLQETVKGYAVMKNEFEKLLGAINGLEEEKRELETELERAKRMAEQGASSGNAQPSAALERIKERFAKVNNELKQMREEKKGKESAFRLMQRENKQCDTLQKELKKLKENRVTMAKQQKSQALQMQKLKKDQVQKAIQFKKSDVKKQQQVNTLKSELVKKERVLGHKDREIARISMKLKACEEHITQLLKMQNRARNAATAGKSTAPSGIPTKAGSVSASAAGLLRSKANLSSAEAEHLQTSKAMLEHMLIDRLDRHISRILYDQKAVQLAELNREMEQDAAELEELLLQKKNVIADMRSRGVLPAAIAGSGADGEDGVDEADSQLLDEEVDLGEVSGRAANGLTEEEKYQVSQLKTSIEMVENSLERLTKEVDICNADIDELSLRIESADKGAKAAQDSAWDEMGREIVTGLSVAQSHSLLWDLMDEKLKTLEQLRIAHSSLSKSQGDLNQEVDKNQELNDWVTALRQELKTRLERAEKLRVDDMWALMQASNASKNGILSAEDAALLAAREDAASRIAILRAHELEKELEIALNAEDALKEDVQDKVAMIHDLQRKVSELKMRADYSENECIWTDVGGMITEGDHSDEVKRITTQTERDGRTSLQPGPDSYMDQLFTIWEELGLPEEERSEALDYVQKSRKLAKERAVVDAQAHLMCVKKEVEVATERLQVLCSALGSTVDKYVPELSSGRTTQPQLLIPLLGAIDLGSKRAEQDIEQKFAALNSVKDRLTEVMSEMWLEIKDLPPALKPLAKLVLPASGDSSSDLAAVMQVAEQLSSMKASLLGMVAWEAEIRKLNLVRVQLTTKLVTVRDASVQLLSELQMRDPKAQLTKLMKGAAVSSSARDSTGEDQLSTQAVNAAVQILVTNSASNPPGSEKLLVALERVKLVLESVKVNRTTVAQLTARYVELFTSHFPAEASGLLAETGTEATLQQAKENQACSTDSLEQCFTVATAVKVRSSDLNDRLRYELTEAISEISPNHTIEQCDTLIREHLKASKTAQTASTLMDGMSEVVEELDGMVMFVEEEWVQVLVHAVTQSWSGTKLYNLMQENNALAEELTRLQGVCEAQRELVKADSALTKHVVEMEDFEEKSKEGRAKALSGNSRLLVEEEKFRKTGKKKYEVLSEKMLQLFAKLNALTSGNNSTGAAVPHIDVRPTLAALSAKGKGLLKGRFKERIELMHLQLSTGPAVGNTEPRTVPHTVSAAPVAGLPHTPSALPLASKAKKGGMYAAHPPTPPTHVFDFSQNNEVGRSSSGDGMGHADKGITLTGRASGDSVGTVPEKENRVKNADNRV